MRRRSQVRRFIEAVGTRLDGSPLALMLDIDGTLAPIAPRPQDAGIPAETRDVLRGLVRNPDVIVALVSGRSADDALRMAAIDGVWIVGNHGFEIRTPDGHLSADESVRPYEEALSLAARDLTPLERSIPGAIVENKRWGLSLHFRLVEPHAVSVLIQRAQEVARGRGLRVFDGKKSIELRPPVRIDKGTAAIALAERVGALREGAGGGGAGFYAGDDRTDEDAFRALRQRYPHAVTARVASAEDFAAAHTEAEFVLHSPDELRQVLEWLAARRARGDAD